VSAVRQALERRRRQQSLLEPAAIAVPAEPSVENLVVVPHDLAG
jgi:hypothetical protein